MLNIMRILCCKVRDTGVLLIKTSVEIACTCIGGYASWLVQICTEHRDVALSHELHSHLDNAWRGRRGQRHTSFRRGASIVFSSRRGRSLHGIVAPQHGTAPSISPSRQHTRTHGYGHGQVNARTEIHIR